MTRSIIARIAAAALGSAITAAIAAPPVAAVRPVTDTYFGQAVTDPYRYMEDLSAPEVQQWAKAQADLTRTTLDAIPARATLLAPHRRARSLGAVTRERCAAPARRHLVLREARRDRQPVQGLRAARPARRRAAPDRPGRAGQGGRRRTARGDVPVALGERQVPGLRPLGRRLRGSVDPRPGCGDAEGADRADRPRPLQPRQLDAGRQRILLLPPATAGQGRAGVREVQAPDRLLPRHERAAAPTGRSSKPAPRRTSRSPTPNSRTSRRSSARATRSPSPATASSASARCTWPRPRRSRRRCLRGASSST